MIGHDRHAVAAERMRANEWYAKLLDALQLALIIGGRDLDLFRFMLHNGRMPAVGDEREPTRMPWEYCGWLLPYIMDLMPINGAAGRWGYWYQMAKTGEIPASGRPPRIKFTDPENPEIKKQLAECVRLLDQNYGSGVGMLIDWLAWALAVTDHSPTMSQDHSMQLYRTLSIDKWLRFPADYLGWLMEDYGSRSNKAGFFVTPQPLAEIMARMVADDDGDFDGLITISDPALGTGRFLLEASNFSVRLFGQDINPRCALAAMVNGAIYAPWLAFPVRLRKEVELADAKRALHTELAESMVAMMASMEA